MLSTLKPVLLLSMPGGSEWILIVLVVLLFFGGKKIPDLMRGIGKGIREFNDAKEHVKNEIEAGMKEKEVAPAAPAFDPYKCSMRRCPPACSMRRCPPACPQGAEHAAPAEGPPSRHARRAHGPAAAWRRLARRARPLALGLHPGL